MNPLDFAPGSRKTLLVAASLIAIIGCRGGQSSGESEARQEHAGHVIPAHKPKDFPSAIRRLRELNGQITSKLADGQARALVTEKTLPISLDIANWLPEIAADSEMPESPWDEVNGHSSLLVSVYQKLIERAVIEGPPADASALSIEAGLHVKALGALLDSANPRWFDPTKLGVR
jgi:hypothetical protein